MVLTGAVIARDGERIKIDAMAENGRLHGALSVAVEDRTQTVRSIEVEVTDGQDRVRLHWDRR
jgi:hypothetical protein